MFVKHVLKTFLPKTKIEVWDSNCPRHKFNSFNTVEDFMNDGLMTYTEVDFIRVENDTLIIFLK